MVDNMFEKQFTKKLLKSLNDIYKDKYVVINSELPSLNKSIGKIDTIYLSGDNNDEVMVRVQTSPGPFPYDGIEKLKNHDNYERVPFDDIKFVDSMMNEKPVVYLVIEEWMFNGESSRDIQLFLGKEQADMFKRFKRFKESDRDGIIYRIKYAAWNSAKDIDEIHMGDTYICGIKDSEPREFYKIKIEEVPINA